MNAKHPPEPWHQNNEGMIVDANGKDVYFCDANVQRYVACVNACAGIADPEAAINCARKALTIAADLLDPITQANSKAEARRALALLGQ